MKESTKDLIEGKETIVRELKKSIFSLEKDIANLKEEAVTKCNHKWKTLKNYEHEGGNCIKCGLNQLYVESELRRMK